MGTFGKSAFDGAVGNALDLPGVSDIRWMSGPRAVRPAEFSVGSFPALRTPREPGCESERGGLVDALLSRERYGSILEIGCAEGELGHVLLERCGAYVGIDADDGALARARCSIIAGSPMRFLPLRLASVLPAGEHELVILSDVLSRFPPSLVRDVARRLAAHAPCREIVVVGDREEHTLGVDPALAAFAAELGPDFVGHEAALRRHYRIDVLLRRPEGVPRI